MNKVSEIFKNGKAFIGFVTGGDPNLDTTEKILYEMEAAGTDLIEIGIPFSDPIAEGPVIQDANERALGAGCTTDKLLDTVKKARKNLTVPLLFMTYANAIYKYGTDRFMERCVECGIDGIIVPDVPFEEKAEFEDACKSHGLVQISMIAPTSAQRIAMISKEAEGFIYVVSSMGVTGVRSEFNTDLDSIVKTIKENTDVPCAIGFGISTPEHAKVMSQKADGVIVGSAIVKIVAQYGEEAPAHVGEYIRSMKSAIS